MGEKGSVPRNQEKHLIESLRLVHRIVSRKLGASHRDSVEDVKQQVFLKIWRWKSKHEDRDLTEEEWLKLANKAAHNAVNDFFSNKHRRAMPISQMNEDFQETISANHSGSNNPEGNSQAEVRSLLSLIWKFMHGLSLRQKYSYLFHQPDFIIDFIAAGCCSMKELARSFEITEVELLDVLEAYPLSDAQISALLEEKQGAQVSLKQVREARSKAKAKIAERWAEYISDGRLPDRRKT